MFMVENIDLERLESALAQFNIFDAIGVTRQELRHPDFLAFLLDPTRPHGLSDAFAKSLLQRALMAQPQGTFEMSPLDLALWPLDRLVVLREWQNIDVLLVDEDHDLVVVIENKIGSGEHSSQLGRYLDIARRRYPRAKLLALYLTPDGAAPSHEDYLAVDYRLISDVVETVVEARRSSLDPSVHMTLTHYAGMLRRHVVADSEIAELCRLIYQKHQRAIDLIVEHRPDELAILHDFLVDLVQTSGELILDESDKTYVRFTVPVWELPSLCGGNGWTSTGRMLLFEFRSAKNRLTLALVIGPGPQEIRDRIMATACAAGPPFRMGKHGQKWTTIFSQSIIGEESYESTSRAERQQRIMEYFDPFLGDELPAIVAALDIPAALTEPPVPASDSKRPDTGTPDPD